MKIKVKVLVPMVNGKFQTQFGNGPIDCVEYVFEMSIVGVKETKDIIDAVGVCVEKNFPFNYTKIVSVEETGRDNILNG